jgi:hypothetical protein
MYQAILTRVSFVLKISNDVVQQELEEYQDMGGNSGGNDGGGKLIVHVLTITIFDNHYV